MFTSSRPGDVVVLNGCVTETKVTLCLSRISIIFMKSRSEREKRSTLYRNRTWEFDCFPAFAQKML